MIIERLAHLVPAAADLTDPGYQADVRTLAEELEEMLGSSEAALELEGDLVASTEPVPIPLRVALKLAMSRLALAALPQDVHVSVVFAVYKEHVRILSRAEHEHGEDFLRQKLAQLGWLFARTPRHSWDLTVVDDGCPEGSGELAQRIVDDLGVGDRVTVLFLEQAIQNGVPIARGLTSTDESRKGGSIRYGLWHALQTPHRTHVLLYTDADLSTDLAQAGLLVEPIVADDRAAASGSRRRRGSVVVKGDGRNMRGKLFIYLWKRLIPQLQVVVDTQCGFKAFAADGLRRWLPDTSENGFAFDIEYLLRVELDSPGSVARIPIAWIDSEELSTTTDLQPYPTMLRSVVSLYRQYEEPTDDAESFARMIESLDDATFEQLLDSVPTAIAERDPHEFDEFAGVTAAELADIASARTG